MRRSVTRPMLRAAVTRPILIVVAEIPRLTRGYRLAAAHTDRSTYIDDPLYALAQLLVSGAVACLRARRARLGSLALAALLALPLLAARIAIPPLRIRRKTTAKSAAHPALARRGGKR